MDIGMVAYLAFQIDENTEPVPHWMELAEDERVRWRQAADAVVMYVRLQQLPGEDEPLATPQSLCEIHDNQDAAICGGPHRKVLTDLGWEVLAPGEQPEGTPKAPE